MYLVGNKTEERCAGVDDIGEELSDMEKDARWDQIVVHSGDNAYARAEEDAESSDDIQNNLNEDPQFMGFEALGWGRWFAFFCQLIISLFAYFFCFYWCMCIA